MAGLRTKSSPAVEKALAILEILARSRRGLGLSQIPNHLCLPRSSAFSFLLTTRARRATWLAAPGQGDIC